MKCRHCLTIQNYSCIYNYTPTITYSNHIGRHFRGSYYSTRRLYLTNIVLSLYLVI